MDDRTELIRRKYNRFARFYDLGEGMMESRRMTNWRRELWEGARGDVLEVGVGTGRNMRFYPPGARVTAIDFSPRMLERARRRAGDAGIKVDLRLMDAQRMEFPDDSFDTVIATCVFCSVPDPVQGLREIRRICRPDGRVFLLEHMRSEYPVIGGLMDVFNPVSVGLLGVNINRRTLANIEAAGLQIVEVRDLVMDIVKKIIASPAKENRRHS